MAENTAAGAFATLSIEPTKDEAAIRDAYHRLLPEHHPEEDPEGFKAFREAYEAALEYTRSADGDVATADNLYDPTSPVGKFMSRAIELYERYARRIKPEEWESLLAGDELFDIEYGDELQRALLSYLAGHFRIPASVWRVIDRRLNIRENAAAFDEFLPDGFMGFIIARVSADDPNEIGEFLFEGLSGTPERDADGSADAFIADYIAAFNDMSPFDTPVPEARQALDKLNAYGFSHPILSLSEYALNIRESDKSPRYAEDAAALWARYPRNFEVESFTIRLLYLGGYTDEFLKKVNEVEDRLNAREYVNPTVTYYLCRCYGQYLAENNSLREAYDYAIEAWQISENEDTTAELADIANHLMDEFENTADGEVDDETAERYLNAAINANEADRALSHIEKNKAWQRDTASYHYFVAVLHRANEDYNKAIKELQAAEEICQRELEAEAAGSSDSPQPEAPNEATDADDGAPAEPSDTARFLARLYVAISDAMLAQSRVPHHFAHDSWRIKYLEVALKRL